MTLPSDHNGQNIVVTKRGRPVARIVPARETPRASLKGSVVVRGDIVAPVLDDWEIDR